MLLVQKQLAADQLAQYGYALSSESELIGPKGERTGVLVTHTRNRFRTVGAGSLDLWSGPDLGAFLSKFWFAKKVVP